MADARVAEFPFQLPEGFNLRDYLANSFGIWDGHGEVCVKIRFSPIVARTGRFRARGRRGAQF
jgi:hypothetical protein